MDFSAQLIVLCVGVFILAMVLTAALRRYALSHSLIDIPNQRSSHNVPTPRGGGVAIVLSFFLVLAALGWAQYITTTHTIALIGSGFCIALVGFLDDHGHIAARWRLVAHFCSAAWLLYWLGGLPPLDIFSFTLASGIFSFVIGVFYVVWLLNLYNFMDGIDGLASAQAISVTIGGVLLYFLVNEPQFALLPVTLACAVAGFLVWNFPPAKIFMGDAGSGFLGVILAGLSIQAGWVQPQLFFSWLILLGVFIVDATLTLLMRLIRGQKVYEAHRSHAYQHAAIRYRSHFIVTMVVLVINIVWLLPMAYLVAMQTVTGAAGMLIAYIPLLLLAIWFRAGRNTLDNPELCQKND